MPIRPERSAARNGPNQSRSSAVRRSRSCASRGACAALKRLLPPRGVQDDQRHSLVPQPGEHGSGIFRQRPSRDSCCERQAAGERIVPDHCRERPGFRCVDDPSAPEPDAVQRQLPARLAPGVDGVLVQQHLRLVHERVKTHRVGSGWKLFIDRKPARRGSRRSLHIRRFLQAHVPARRPHGVEEHRRAEMAVERLDQRFGLGARNLEGVGHPETVAAHPQVHGIGAHPVVPFGSSAVRQERIRGDRPVALLRYAEALEQPGFGRNERDPLAASSRDQRLRGRKAV